MKRLLVLAFLVSSPAAAESWICDVEDNDPWLRLQFTVAEDGAWSVGGMPGEGDLFDYPACEYAAGYVVCGGLGLELIFHPATGRAVHVNVAEHLAGYDDGKPILRLYWCRRKLDLDLAPQWFKEVIRERNGQTNAAAQDVGRGVEAYDRGDYGAAVEEWRPLAEQGVASAQFNLGHLYFEGSGVLQDYREAQKWYRLAAEQGHAGAQNSLGVIYAKGLGVPQDYGEAVKWFRLAAEQASAEAQISLGHMYEHGLGLPQDFVQAHMWFNLAAAQGAEQAVHRRDIVALRMSPAQVAEAQKLAREWMAKNGG